MADYNPNYMAAYQQYAQTMKEGGGGTSLSGQGSTTMAIFNQTKDDKQPAKTGLGAKPATTQKEDKEPSFWDRITAAFSNNNVSVGTAYQPTVNPTRLYEQDKFQIADSLRPVAGYVHRAEQQDAINDAVKSAMGIAEPITTVGEELGVVDYSKINGKNPWGAVDVQRAVKLPAELQDRIFKEVLNSGLIEQRPMTPEEKKKWSAIVPSPVTTEPLTEAVDPALVKAVEKALDKGGVTPEQLNEILSTAEFIAYRGDDPTQGMSSDELEAYYTGVAEGTIDPDTGQPIQSSAEVVANEVQKGLMSRPTPSNLDTSNKGMSFLTFISKGEGGYESSNRGTKNNKIQGSTHSTTRDDKKLSEMTIDDIRAKMKIKNPDNPDRLFAVGKYQLIPSTFEMAVKATGLSGDTVFNPKTQEKLGEYLLFKKRPALGAYIKGESDDINKALLEAAKEWASLPVPSGSKQGKSYYGKGNKAQHTLDETINALNEARNAYMGQ